MTDHLAVATGADGVEVHLYDDRVEVEGQNRRRDIPLDALKGVHFSGPGFLGNGYVQFEQDGVELDDGGIVRPPADENTVHFPAAATHEFRALVDRLRGLLAEN